VRIKSRREKKIFFRKNRIRIATDGSSGEKENSRKEDRTVRKG
jgi:hypothetical protein